MYFVKLKTDLINLAKNKKFLYIILYALVTSCYFGIGSLHIYFRIFTTEGKIQKEKKNRNDSLLG